MKYLNCPIAQYFLTASTQTQKLDLTLTPVTVRRLSHQTVPFRTRPKCALHIPSSPFGRAVFPKKCVWTSSYASRRSVICRDSLLTIVRDAPSFSLFLSVLQSRFIPWYPLNFHHLQAQPSLQRDPLIWIKHQVRCVRSLSFPRDQSFSLPHWADSQDLLTDAYITFSGTRSSLRIQMSWLKHHLATTLGSISAWRNRLLPLIKT